MEKEGEKKKGGQREGAGKWWIGDIGTLETLPGSPPNEERALKSGD
jgi:hypothetical protein